MDLGLAQSQEPCERQYSLWRTWPAVWLEHDFLLPPNQPPPPRDYDRIIFWPCVRHLLQLMRDESGHRITPADGRYSVIKAARGSFRL